MKNVLKLQALSPSVGAEEWNSSYSVGCHDIQNSSLSVGC